MISCPRLTIAGLSGDSGKTVVSVGLSRFLADKGYRVVPFKKGPDYIDMEWLSRGASHPCYNVDLFLMNRDQALGSFCLNAQGADCAVIEGNRGLYDGMDVEGSVSTAEIAKLLKSPVILVIDCTKMTRTAAALVLGCQKFDDDVVIAGVILNRLAGARHESTIRKSIESYCRIPVLGTIPKLRNVHFPDRHLGLVPPQEHPGSEEAIRTASDIVRTYVDTARMLEIAQGATLLDCPVRRKADPAEKKLRIGIIRDSAFQFYYPENLEELTSAGGDLIEFSALEDSLPPSLDALYIGGGFPETHAAALAENVTLRNDIKDAAENGLPIYAECGGLMYLSRELVWEGRSYPMAGVFPVEIGVGKKPCGHGYTLLEVRDSNPFYAPGQKLRGHEFHYSFVRSVDPTDRCRFVFGVMRGEGIADGREGLLCRNALATYTHIHAMGTPEWTQGMLRAAWVFRNKNLSVN